MASLEELLAEEGFKKGRLPYRSSRSSLGLKTVSMPVYLHSESSPATSEGSVPTVRIRTERTRSDVSKLGSKTELQKNDIAGGRRSRKDLRQIERLILESKVEMQDNEIDEAIARSNLHKDDIFDVSSSRSTPESLRYEVRKNPGFLESPNLDDSDWKNMQQTENFKDRFLYEFQEDENMKDNYFSGFLDGEGYENRTRKNSQENERNRNRSTISMVGKKNISKEVSKKSSLQKCVELQSQTNLNMKEMVSEPALDEVATRAMVSILTSYIGRFLKDKNFRLVLRHNCMSCLNFAKADKDCQTDVGVALNLRQAIEKVERVAEEFGNLRELKKAAIQLSIFAGLNSRDLKDGFTSGIPNLCLAACAHLYLSVIYKLLRKDRVSAKHLLLVFCDSPFQARITLLPDLWDHLFLPHLSHLRVWYDQEAEAVAETHSRQRKIKLLDKVYNEILDSGTYQFAFYYKEWLTAGIDAPAVPSIHLPEQSVSGVSCRGSHEQVPDPESSPAGSISSQPIISRRLYEAVFGHHNRLAGTLEFKNEESEKRFSNDRRNFDDKPDKKDGIQTNSPNVETSAVQNPGKKSLGSALPNALKGHVDEPNMHFICRDHQQDTEKLEFQVGSCDKQKDEHGEELFFTSQHTWGSREVADEVKDIVEKSDLTKICPNNNASTMVLHKSSNAKENELTLKKLAKAVFQRQTDDFSDSSDFYPPLHSKCMPALDRCGVHSCMKCDVAKTRLGSRSSIAGTCRNCEYLQISSSFSSIPKDFICPLTGQLFEDPVTIETGQTFDRAAFKEWLDQGNETCPVTGRMLATRAIPVTNFVLKHVVDGWKSEHCRNLLVSATQIASISTQHELRSKDEAALFMMEQLLINCNSEERTDNAKRFLSIGGLQFLIQRFELGDSEEKTLVAALMLCCIDANGACRNDLAQNIKRPSLIELLHSKQVKSRTTAVLLLTELICLNRRTVVTSFLNSLHKEGIINTLHILLVYLQGSALEQKPLVSVLILHFDLLVEPRKYSIYREEAVDAIIAALYCSLVDQQIKQQCCRALLILGAHFSYSGEVLTKTWLLKQAGYYDDHNDNSLKDDTMQDDVATIQEEEKAREEWLTNLAALLLGNGKKSFLESISKCINCESQDLVQACLVTVAWLSHSLSSMPDAEFQLSAFSSLIHPLKQNLENEQVEHRVLACLSLFNFSEISECRVLLLAFAEELVNPLQKLTEITWRAKHLHSIISGD